MRLLMEYTEGYVRGIIIDCITKYYRQLRKQEEQDEIKLNQYISQKSNRHMYEPYTEKDIKILYPH